MSAVDGERLQQVSRQLGEAAIDPAMWPEILEGISTAIGATGVALLQSEARTPDIPRTAGVEEAFDRYFAEGWANRDIFAEKSIPLMLRGQMVVTDQDILTLDDMRRSELHRDLLARYGLRWWAAVGFRSGSALWALVMLRSRRAGQFEAKDKRSLGFLSRPLTETATLSRTIGRAAVSGMTTALQLIKQPAVALDWTGSVIDMNAPTELIFDDEVRICHHRLLVCDQRAQSALNTLLDHIRTTPTTMPLPAAPIVVQRRSQPPLVIRVLPVAGAARSPFLGAHALLVFTDLSRHANPQPDVLARTFGLTPAEARLTALIAAGGSPEEASGVLGIARQTARNQLKAVFAKTDTHRQAELVALLSRVSAAP